MNLPLEPILFGFLIVTALMVTVETNLFAAAMLTGLFSLISASLFVLMDAVDVAFTEASVGAGISTVLILGTLALTGRKEDQQPARMFPFVISLLVGATLVVGTLGMPRYGDPSSPIHNGTSKKILEGEFPAAEAQSPAAKKRAKEGKSEEYKGPRAVGLQNVVTSILGSYRGYDTLGETAVIFTAGVGVMLLLVGRRRRPEDGTQENPPDEADEESHADDASEPEVSATAEPSTESDAVALDEDAIELIEDVGEVDASDDSSETDHAVDEAASDEDGQKPEGES